MADLLPSNATAFERAVSETADMAPRIAPGLAAMRAAKWASIPDDYLPFLIYERGLGEVSAYVPDRRELLSRGIDWQRVRGTPEALRLGLDWVGYRADLIEHPARRRRWHLFSLGLDRPRDQEEPDLERIEGIASLSVPVRSQFWRGFSGYDYRGAEWSYRAYSGAAWSNGSGVRIRDGGAIWSFGRTYDFTRVLGQPVLTGLGVWEPPVGDEPLTWADPVAWQDTSATWEGGEDARDRLARMVDGLMGRGVYAIFYRADGTVIGSRRARVVRPVVPAFGGQYQVGTVSLAVDAETPTGVFVEVLTDFGDGYGDVAANVALAWSAAPIDPATPGKAWLARGELSAGFAIFILPVSITFGRTTRERLRFHLQV